MPVDYLAKRPEVSTDTECYPNLWAIGFKAHDTGRKVILSIRHGREDLDRARIAKILYHHRIYTFNGDNYDWPMISYAMAGASCSALKKMNDTIIPGEGKKGPPAWEIYEKFETNPPPNLDTIDLWNVAPSAAQRFSLKKYAACMHSRWLKELPYDPMKWLTDSEIEEVLAYLENDLDVTHDLADEMSKAVQLRAVLSAKYNFDFRSKSDAQCGESVMKLLAERETGRRIYRPDIQPGPFKLECPDYIKFQTPYMRDMLDKLLRSEFVVGYDGYVELPAMFVRPKKKKKGEDIEIEVDLEEDYEDGEPIRIGKCEYRMGIGGLHSNEKSISHYSDDDVTLRDRDVTSYYPNLMLRSGREPDNMRGKFKKNFQGLVDERTEAKDAGNKDKAESMKIFVNGIFGKTGSPWSVVYSPKMMIQTTVPGQLAILMVIEELELRKFEVVSANTDGFVTKVPNDRYDEFCAVMTEWEWDTGLRTEETVYKSLHSRDVNNYLAFAQEKDGSIKVKRKGWFAPSGRGVPAALGLKKTPDFEVCADAAIAFLKDGVPPEQTVRNCQDIRKFVKARKVQGGAEQDGEYIGKTVRFYISQDGSGLRYITSGNNVPKSDGAMPCMVLPDELPGDIDYAFYEREAYAVLDDLGVDVIDPTLRGRSGMGFGRLPDQKTVHIVDWGTGLACCGMARKSRRDLWVEYSERPDGRVCRKCDKASDI